MKTKQGSCYCGRPATKRKMGAWCCDRCASFELKMKTETGSQIGLNARVKYSEFDFRGAVCRVVTGIRHFE